MNWLQKLIAKFHRKPVKPAELHEKYINVNPEPACPRPAVPRRTPVSSAVSNVQYKQAVRSHLNLSAKRKPNYPPAPPAPVRNITREYHTETRVERSSDIDLTPLVVAYMMHDSQQQTSPSYSCPAPAPEKYSSGGGGDFGGGGASGSWDSGSSSSDSGSSNDNY